MVAFNGKREAARAAFDALPLIKQAGRTEIIWIDPPEAEGEDETLGGSELAEALARHGVGVEVLARLPPRAAHAQDVRYASI